MKIKLFVLSNRRDLLESVPEPRAADVTHQKVYLHDLPLGRLQSNMLGEGRAILHDLDYGDADYVGLANARWDHKYDKLGTRLGNLGEIALEMARPHVVLAPWPTNADWLNYGPDWPGLTVAVHPSMANMLQELYDFTGMPLNTGLVSFWANDFICRREVFESWREHWRRCFNHFHGRYGFLLPYRAENMDVRRLPAYFYERVTTHYFANRVDLEVVRVP